MKIISSISLCMLLVCGVSMGDKAEFWVDGTKGNDDNPGTEEKPFKTISKSRDVIRSLKNTTGLPDGGVVVTVIPGDYEFLDSPLEFTSEDSGTEKSPILYTSFTDSGIAHLTAGKQVNWIDHIRPVQDPVIRALIKNEENIVQIDLRKLGISDYGELESGQLGDCANNKLELFSPDMNMVLARYPNIDMKTGQWQWLSAGKVIDKQKSFEFNTDNVTTQRILSWKNTTTLWLHGYWSYDWADNYVKVDSIDAKANVFTVSEKTPPLDGFVANARYYALNILEELDAENEYYVDRGSGILYLYESTARMLSATNQGCVSVGENVINLDNVSFVQFNALNIDCSRSTAITATNVNNITITAVTIHDVGGAGLSVSGYNNTLTGIKVTKTGCGGIHLSGGDQKTLTRGNNILMGSEISYWSNWKRTYNPGLSWGGVGNLYTENHLMNAPHSGILGGGNDCVFENNTLDTLCYESSDSGAFYSGRSWIDRGNIIRGNTFKNILNTEKTHLGYPSVQAIYLDDQMSGYTVVGNHYINCHCGTFIGGGRRNQVHSNIYENCSTCVHVDDRGLTWQKSDCSPGGMFEQQLKSVNYQQPPWSTHYPELVNIMSDHPCIPVYNSITDNQYCKSTQFIDVSEADWNKWMITVKNNTNSC